MEKLGSFKKLTLAISMLALVAVCAPSLASANCPADLNGDATVGFADLTTLLGAWGPCDMCAPDINGDGNVGFADLTTLLGAWGPCPVSGCFYHDDCATGEYCAGEGCQADGDWYGPLPEGVCTPMADPATCVGEPIQPVCACNNQLRLTTCDLQVYGERYRQDGFCPQIQCPSGLATDCPPNHVCHDGGGTVPNICLPE